MVVAMCAQEAGGRLAGQQAPPRPAPPLSPPRLPSLLTARQLASLPRAHRRAVEQHGCWAQGQVSRQRLVQQLRVVGPLSVSGPVPRISRLGARSSRGRLGPARGRGVHLHC